MRRRRSQTPSQTRGISDFFSEVSFTWHATFVEGTAYEARLKQEGTWKTAHRVSDNDEEADIFNDAQLDCFYNGCPIDDIEIDGPYVGLEGDLGEDGGCRPLTAAEWASVALHKPDIQMLGWGGYTTYKAPDGEKFTVRQLFDVLVEYIRRQKRIEWAEGTLNPDHCFFEGLHPHDEGYYTIWWGS